MKKKTRRMFMTHAEASILLSNRMEYFESPMQRFFIFAVYGPSLDEDELAAEIVVRRKGKRKQ